MEEVKLPKPRIVDRPLEVQAEARRLRERPDLCFAIVAILGAWNDIEDDLSFIFAIASGAEPAVAASILRPVVAIGTKLDVVKRSIELRFGNDLAKRFMKGSRSLRKASELRNEIAHGHWCVHDDFPESFIRLDGIKSPLLEMKEWGREELLQAFRYLQNQQLALREFEQELLAFPVPIPSAADQGRAWRLVRSHGQPDRVLPPSPTAAGPHRDPAPTTNPEPASREEEDRDAQGGDRS